jgi:alpha-L-rhamnosidase
VHLDYLFAGSPGAVSKTWRLAHVDARAVLALLFLGAVCLQAAENRPPTAPTGLLTDLLPEPLGIENPNPRLSWIVNDPDRQEHQSAYQILIGPCPEQLASDQENVWDSGKVKSSDSSNVRYGGDPLEPDRIYYWKVRTWDKEDQSGPYSDPQRLVTGLGDQWIAVPVWAGSAPDAEPNFLFLRRAFTLSDKPVRSATAHVTALSPEPAAQYVYKLYLNGTFVGTGPERGFDGLHRYNTFEVADLLRRGTENVVGALNYTTEDKRFLFQMRVMYEDGTSQTIQSDGTWKALDGDLIYRDLGNAGHGSYHYVPREGIDARRYPFGWNDRGFDDRKWEPATEKERIGNLQASATANTQRHLIRPRRIVEKEHNRYFIEFDRNVLAGIRLDLVGTAGHEVEIRLGEELSEPNTVRYNLRTGNTYQEMWTLTNGRQALENFGYRVFRYAEILNAPAGFNADRIRAVVLRYPFDDHASYFASSDTVLNDVWELCKYTIKGTSLDVYVDTHTRERRNYEGDALVNQLSHYAVDREFALPRYSVEYLYYRPTWPAEYKPQSILMAWNDYMYTGNPDSIRRHFDVLRNSKLFEEYINHDSLVEKPVNLGGLRYGRDLVDWPASQQDGYEFTTINTVINAFHCAALERLARLAEVAGKLQDAQQYAELANRQRRAINEHLYDVRTGRFRDGKTSNHSALHASAFPLALRLVDPDKVGPVADYVQSRGMAVSVYGAQFLLEGLYHAQRGEAALSLMNATEGNSWGHKIYHLGATMVCEAWDPSQKGNMSYSHAWASAPANVIPRGLFGIVPLEPAFRRFQVKPQPASLDWATLTVPTIRGSIRVEFRQAGDRFEMTVEVPVNTRACVHVPILSEDDPVMFNGSAANGRIQNGYRVFTEVGSGRHRFRRR